MLLPLLASLPEYCAHLLWIRLYSPRSWQRQIVRPRDMPVEGREPGVSGYYRVFNEEHFLAASVASHLPYFDEIIIVYDATTGDDSPAIAASLQRRHPEKIKVFPYLPEVIGVGHPSHLRLPFHHPRSFINYYSWALAKTTKSVIAKLDADQIAIPSQFRRMRMNIEEPDFMKNTFYSFAGINLRRSEDDRSFVVDGARPLHNLYDHGFVPMSRERRYCDLFPYRVWHLRHMEVLKLNHAPQNNSQIAGIAYFHLKELRPNIAFQNYQGGEHGTAQMARYRARQRQAMMGALPWDQFVDRYRARVLKTTHTDLLDLPDPNRFLKALL